jgi:hypothetical protein
MKHLYKFLPFLAMVILFFVFFSLNKTEIRLNTTPLSANTGDQLWQHISEGSFTVKGERRIIPNEYKIFRTEYNSLRSIFGSAPFEFSDRALSSNYIIELPMPDGSNARFAVTEYSMMEEELAQKFPDIKTYNLKGIDDPYATGKADFTLHGFHAMVLSARGDFFIDPYSTNETEVYISYYKRNFSSDKTFDCQFDPAIHSHDDPPTIPENAGGLNSGPQLRTYRLACAATGEYTVFHGGTVALGMSAIVTAINRVTGVYEREFAVRLVLIANNDQIVYTNGATDPYNNNSGSQMLGQNQTNLDNVIGNANYDIGHVFSTGGGGVAGLRVVCISGQKARGVTGLPSPIGDPFYIDYVAHEIGHQYGGNHSFNGNAGSCSGGNRNPSTAYEPGSGSTIMAYAGICGSQNIQTFSDDYFHTINFQEIVNYTQFGNGSICPVVTNTGNTPPTITTMPLGGFTIPVSTPFSLTGVATDLENPNSITYCWEQFDLGPAGHPNTPSGDAPIFRSFKPDTTGTRIFPRISNIVNNNQTIGEILPTYTRNLNFRLTARDNNIVAGGVSFQFISFTANAGAGPFIVTNPNTNLMWNPVTPFPVTWNIANTNTAPVNCQLVNIKLSTDGGFTYPVTLATNTPNDGLELVNLPIIETTTARIKVEAADNVFFDISNVNFTITTMVDIQNTGNGVPEKYELSQNYPNPFNPETKINFGLPFGSDVKLSIFDISGKEIVVIINSSLNAGQYNVNFNAKDLSSGTYFYRITAISRSGIESFIMTKKMLVLK